MPYFDRFDICAAYNLYSQLYGWDEYTHGIQFRLAKLKYKPSRSEETLEGLEENVRLILEGLVEHREGAEALAHLYEECEHVTC